MLIPIAELLVYIASFFCYLRFKSHINLNAADGTKGSLRLVLLMNLLMFFGWMDLTTSCMAILRVLIVGAL